MDAPEGLAKAEVAEATEAAAEAEDGRSGTRCHTMGPASKAKGPVEAKAPAEGKEVRLSTLDLATQPLMVFMSMTVVKHHIHVSMPIA